MANSNRCTPAKANPQYISTITQTPYFDFSETMVDKKYFYNAGHLNANGARIFSTMLADTLIKVL